MRQVILFESFKQKHKALVLLAQPVTPLYLCYLQNKIQHTIFETVTQKNLLFVQPVTQPLFLLLAKQITKCNFLNKNKLLGLQFFIPLLNTVVKH
jgi:hypothetical protein